MSSLRFICLITALSLTLAKPVFGADERIPNDPGFTQQWYLKTIGAPRVWEEGAVTRGSLGQGSADVIVAVIDSGVDIEHPDLKANIWTNPREIPDNNIDDDHDGYVDNVHGWDFISNSASPVPKLDKKEDLKTSPLGVHHGTILAGIIGAVGNNQQGIAGVSWQASIMPLRAIHSDGTGDAVTVSKAIEYAIDHKANIINLSFVGDASTPELLKSIKKAAQNDILVVAAAGNEVRDAQGEKKVFDLDAKELFPICHDGPPSENWVIGVTATDREDVKSSFASFGSRCIDVSAPGQDIISTRATNPDFGTVRPYGFPLEGTSMSAAVVSGSAALLKTLFPAATMRSIGKALVDGAHSVDDLNPLFRNRMGAGRIDLVRSFDLLSQGTPVVSATVVAQELPTADTVVAAWSTPMGRTVVQFHYGATQQDKELVLETGWTALPSLSVLSDGRIVLGSPEGFPAQVRIYSAVGELETSIAAYPMPYKGGVSVQVVGSPPNQEIAAFPQKRAGALLRIFTSAGTVVRQKFLFPSSTRGDWVMGPVVGEHSHSFVAIIRADAPTSTTIVHVDRFTTESLPLTVDRRGVNAVSVSVDNATKTVAIGSVRDSLFGVVNLSGSVAWHQAFPKQFQLPIVVRWKKEDTGEWLLLSAPTKGTAHIRQWSVTGVLESQYILSPSTHRGGASLATVVLP